ncbi:MAG: ABC transporter permease [Oscillospiraceae bacterium]|nr:ABC transporter permease [Oscillospiraceae bacterium]
MMGKLRAQLARLKKKQIVFAIVNLALILASAASACGRSSVCHTLISQRAAEAWRGESEMRFAQISVFQPTDMALELADVELFRQTLQTSMTEASLQASENGRLFADAFSASKRLTLTSDKTSVETAAIAVGGDYFLFHPLKLRSGSYLTSTDAMRDRVVLDEELAWALFGSVDVAGMSVRVGEQIYPVAGVVEREDDFASKKAYTAGAGVFICYEALGDDAPDISCYELVLPDVVSGFGVNLVREKFPVAGGVVVENSARYDLLSLLKVAGDFGTRSMNTQGVVYPYWENAARMTEDYASALLLLTLLFAFVPAVSICVTVVWLIRKYGKVGIEKIRDAIETHTEARKEKNYQKTSDL